MEIIEIESGPVATKGYLVVDEESKKAAIIDTPLDSSDYFINFIAERKLDLEYIFLTHSHWDHIADAKKLQENTKASVYVHPADGYRLINPMEHTLMQLPFTIDPVGDISYFNNLDVFNLGSLNLQIIHTPGHTEGGVCLVEQRHAVIFSGDTLFEGSIGRCDLPGGDFDLLIDSIKSRLFVLPDHFKIYCGHGEPTTIGREKQFNPYLN